MKNTIFTTGIILCSDRIENIANFVLYKFLKGGNLHYWQALS